MTQYLPCFLIQAVKSKSTNNPHLTLTFCCLLKIQMIGTGDIKNNPIKLHNTMMKPPFYSQIKSCEKSKMEFKTQVVRCESKFLVGSKRLLSGAV